MIICISGKIGSGKSTLRADLQQHLNYSGYSVSDYLKFELEKRQNKCSLDRENLQTIGEELIKKGYKYFVKNFIEFMGTRDNVIIDGIRHKDFFNELKKEISYTRIVLITLTVSEDERRERIQERNRDSLTKLNEQRLAEGDFNKLVEIADLNIESTYLEEKMVYNQVISFLNQNDSIFTFENIKNQVKEFNDSRGWSKYQNALNVATSINIEASELLENFQWLDKRQSHIKAIIDNENIKEELADVFIYCINFALTYGYDISQLIINKLKKNGVKYEEKRNLKSSI